MANMVNRATSFGCAPLPNGMPNVVCLCSSKPFKSGAKRGISSVCHNGSQTGDSRKWAINICTEGNLFFHSPSAFFLPHPLFRPTGKQTTPCLTNPPPNTALARGSRRGPITPTKPTKSAKVLLSRTFDTNNDAAQDWPKNRTGTLKWIPASATTAPVHHAHGSSGGGNVKTPSPPGTLPYAIFDIDDDEDETAGAGMVRPVGSLYLVVAAGVAAAVMW